MGKFPKNSRIQRPYLSLRQVDYGTKKPPLYTHDKTAVISFEIGKSYTYKELNDRAIQVKKALLET